MANPMVRIHDVETNEVIDREMTDAEAAEYAAQVEVITEKENAAKAALAAKSALLERLNITEDEAKLLLS